MCPWNRKFARSPSVEEFAARDRFADAVDDQGTRALARELCMMSPDDYAAAFRGSAMKRAKRWMLQRNACIVLGNIGTEDDLAVLTGMQHHEHPIVREHAAWAARQLLVRTLRA